MDSLRYPIGRFAFPESSSAADRQHWLSEIEAAPAALREAIAGLNDTQLDTRYRPEGWTLRQVVHHLPDSHMNSYVRFKLAVTEDAPTIRGYAEERWAELAEARTAPVALSLDLLEALHRRWSAFLRTLSASDWERRFVHPDLGSVPLWGNLALYAWHGRHHIAHITGTRAREGW